MKNILSILAIAIALFAAMLFPASTAAALLFADTCTAPDAGGTADLPANCPYDAGTELMYIVDGLPPATTIEITPIFSGFSGIIRTPGGPLGGESETFMAGLEFRMMGTGTLAGYLRTVLIAPVNCAVAAGPRDLGATQQMIPMDFLQMQGQLPPGDPDFDLLRITAGTGFGMPSPGHTTLTKMGGGNWNVESFFDITYRIDFIGAPGGPLAGRSGSTTNTVRWKQGVVIGPADDAINMMFAGLMIQGTMDVIDRLTNDPAHYLALAGETLVPTFVLRNNTGSDVTTTVRCLIDGNLDGGGTETAFNDSVIVDLQGFETKTFTMNSSGTTTDQTPESSRARRSARPATTCPRAATPQSNSPGLPPGRADTVSTPGPPSRERPSLSRSTISR